MPEEFPNFEDPYGLTINPIRLMVMMGTVWYLARSRNARPTNILEVGSWCGASTLCWGQAIDQFNAGLGSVTCIDAWEPYIDLATNPDKNSEAMEAALRRGEPFDVFKRNVKFMPETVKVEIIKGWSQDILPQLAGQSFDLVYLDGDHTYESVSDDLEKSLSMVSNGGIVCGDDLELQADDCDLPILESKPNIDQHFDPDLGVYFHPGVTKAVGEQLGQVSSWYGYWAMQKNGEKWEKVVLNGMPTVLPNFIPVQLLMDLKKQILTDEMA